MTAATAITAAEPKPPTLARNASFNSMLSISLTETPSFTTAPCTRCGHAEPLKSLFSVVEKTVLRCPHCTETFTPNQALYSLPGPEPGEDLSSTLQRSFADLDCTLQRHGAELARLQLVFPTPESSRAGSLRSVASNTPAAMEKRKKLVLKELDGERGSVGLRPYVEAGHDDDARSVCSAVSAGGSENPEMQVTEYSSGRKGGGLSTGGHPLVHDIEDLKQLTAGVTRLLKTLNDKVTRLELDEKMVRVEREELKKERNEVKRWKEELEGQREGGPEFVRFSDGAFSPWAGASLNSRKGRSKSIDFEGSELSRAVSFATIDSNSDSTWTEDKEAQLQALEHRLARANKNWSDEQEDVLQLVEPLREERRRAKKYARRGLTKLDSDSITSPESPHKKSRGSFSFMSGRRSSMSSLNSHRGPASDGARQGSKIMRFFVGSLKNKDKDVGSVSA